MKPGIQTILISIVIFILISACTPEATETLLPVVVETHASPTNTPVSQPPEPTPTSTLSTLEPSGNCSDSASFVADITIPDNENVTPGTAFVKTWRIRNNGTCPWNEQYSMVFVDGEKMNSVDAIPLKATAPGETLDVSVDLVSPSRDGAYSGNYELHNPAGQAFLIDNTQYIWVKIVVGTKLTQTVVPVSLDECTYSENSVILSEMLSLINYFRRAESLQPLTENPLLSIAAMKHSIDMACHSRLSHTGSDNSYITDRISYVGYPYTYWNEAIYAQPPEYGGNAQAAVDWWLNDPPHRVIILSPDATEIGLGYAYVAGSKLGGYFTIDLGDR